MGFSRVGNVRLLGIGVCVVKGSRDQGFKGASGINKLKNLTKNFLLEPMIPRILGHFLDFFGDEASDRFLLSSLSEYPFSIAEDSKSIEELEKLIWF